MNICKTNDKSIFSKVKILSILKKAEVDKAVFYGIIARLWAVIAAPVTILIIANFFTSKLQGYYYTFQSLLALQTFVELGLGIVIIQFASHEWSKLELDKSGIIIGDNTALSRLTSLARFAFRWYLAGASLLIFGLGIGGYIFFSNPVDLTVNWSMPWLILCISTGIVVALIPIWSILEGCNQVANVYTYRFWQGLCVSAAIWLSILSGAKLWAVPISSMAGILCASIFLRKNYWQFLKTLLITAPKGEKINWQNEIWPMQWRLAVGCFCGYFVGYFFVPVLFKYHGPVIAGQMGMTWSVVGFLSSFSAAWVYPKVPQFGMLIAQRNFKELDTLFWRITKIVTVVACLGAIAIWSLVYILFAINHPLANRMLPPLPTGLFLLAQIMQSVSVPLSSYLRAHKREPLLALTILSAILIIPSNLILGKYFSALGMAVGYLIANIIVIPLVGLIWYRCRILWHSSSFEKINNS